MLASAALLNACVEAPAPARAPLANHVSELEVVANEGAEVRVDDVVVGEAPLPLPVVASPGAHRVIVSLNGHHTHSAQVRLVGGQRQQLHVDLHETTQRTLSWALIGTGGAAVAAGIALGVVSVIEDRAARDLDGQGGGDDLTGTEREEYDAAVESRDTFRLASGVTAGAGLAMFVVGGLLFAFDAPEAKAPAAAVTAVPVVDPDFSGVTLRGRF